MKNTKFTNWMIAATADEIRKLADIAHTSVPYLHHIATDRRKPSPELAGRIEEGVHMLRLERRTLPSVDRGELNATCAACPYYKECLGEI